MQSARARERVADAANYRRCYCAAVVYTVSVAEVVVAGVASTSLSWPSKTMLPLKLLQRLLIGVDGIAVVAEVGDDNAASRCRW